eukprot:329518-Hanusia_phi.AAC.2
MARGQSERWWESLREEEDMISLEPLCLLPYEPFELPADENVQTMRWFDGKVMCSRRFLRLIAAHQVLANYLLSTLNFKHPANRRDLSREECVRLDNYLTRFKLDEPRVTHAYDLRADILAKRASEEQRETARRMQHDARAILSSFYGSTNYRSSRRRPRVLHLDSDNGDGVQRIIDDDEEGFHSEQIFLERQRQDDFPSLTPQRQDAHHPLSMQHHSGRPSLSYAERAKLSASGTAPSTHVSSKSQASPMPRTSHVHQVVFSNEHGNDMNALSLDECPFTVRQCDNHDGWTVFLPAKQDRQKGHQADKPVESVTRDGRKRGSRGP